MLCADEPQSDRSTLHLLDNKRRRIMKKIMHTMRKCSIFLAFLFAFTMVFGVSQVQAADGEPYDDKQTGSITVTLEEKEGMNNKGVQLSLYQVGTVETSQGYLDFSLVGELDGVEVDLNDITSPDANTAIAGTLLSAIEDRSIQPKASQWTNEEGKAVFENLDQGMYLVAQETANAYGIILPSVVPIPYANETEWDYNVEIQPKATPVTTYGRIDVTKKLKGLDADDNLQDVSTDNATYYIGLFMDPEGTQPYGGGDSYYQPVHIIDGGNGTVSFSNVPIIDQPYYVFETDANGNAITYLQQQDGENGFFCMAGEVLGAEGNGDAPEIILGNESDAVGDATISNVYTGDLPDGYYYTGELTITKSVMDNGQMISSNDTFYAGIFTVDDAGNVNANPTEVVKLNNNGVVTVEVPLGGMDGTEPITYAVRETNENGVPVSQDNTFMYTVTGEANVNLSLDQTEATVNIVNSLGTADGYYQEPSTQAPTDPNAGNNNNNNSTDRNSSNRNTSSGTNRSSRSSRTGDDNQILLYGGLLAAAVIVGGVVVARRRRRTNG